MIKNEIKTINGGKKGQYGKNYMKIKFGTDDDLPLNKLLKFPTMTIVLRSVFEDDGKCYPQTFLDEFLHELQKIIRYEKIDVSEGIDMNKVHQKNVCFVIIGILKMLVITLNHTFVVNVMMY